MKRHKQSGDFYRKQKKAREEENKKNKGALLKYFDSTTQRSESECDTETSTSCGTSATPSHKAVPSSSGGLVEFEDLPNEPAVVGEQAELLVEDRRSEGINTLEGQVELTTQKAVFERDTEASTSVTSSQKSNKPAVVGEQSELLVEDGNSEGIDTLDSQDRSISDYKDIGTWPISIPDNLRTLIVTRGYKAVQNLDCKFAEVIRPGPVDSTKGPKGVTRKLSRDWFFRTLPNGEKILRTWMAYSPFKESLFCFCCRLFGDASDKPGFNSINGFKKWWKLNPKVHEHESSPVHNDNFNKWKSLEIRLQVGATIDKEAQNVIVKEEQKWRLVLVRILDIIRFLAKQNLSFRGHREIMKVNDTENRGNFLGLVHLLGKYDPVLCEHLTKLQLQKNVSVSYLSPEIQNEFINCLGNHVRTKILAEVKEAKYFTIVFDSTPDFSHKDQTSQILRYVKLEGTKVQVIESFIDFLETEGKNAEDMTKMILDKIESDGLDIQNCRGQAYDNAAVMSGKHSGVQMRIKAVNKNAQFVACTNHSLNLAGVQAASIAIDSVTFFGTMEKVFNFFSSSTHRWKALTDATGQGVKRLIETRWSSRYEAVAAMKTHYSEILEVLESLSGNIAENAATRSDAGLLLTALQSLSFLAFLGLWHRVLREVNDAQLYLQTKGLNVHQCAMKIHALESFLVDNRDVLVNDGLDYAKNICEDLGIEITPRRIRKIKNMAGENAADAGLTYENRLRQEMFESVDRIIQEIKTRFQQLHELDVKYSFLTPTNLLNPEYKCNFGEEHNDIDADDIEIERERLRNFIVLADAKAQDNAKKGSLELLEFIQQCNYGICVPNIVIMLRIFLTIAISVASCERSFSKLKLIKNYLRSTMSSIRLSNLAILSIEHSVTDDINFDEVINDFAARKSRKVEF